MLENSIIGDGKFMVLAHGNDEWMGNFLNGGREEIHTAAEFDELLGSLNSAYKQYAEDKNKKFVLYLYVCHSATVPAYGGPSMAEKISLAHPNAIIQAFDGYGHFKMEDGKARFIGVSTDMTTNNNQGFYIAFKNGKEIWRVPSDDNLRQMIYY